MRVIATTAYLGPHVHPLGDRSMVLDSASPIDSPPSSAWPRKDRAPRVIGPRHTGTSDPSPDALIAALVQRSGRAPALVDLLPCRFGSPFANGTHISTRSAHEDVDAGAGGSPPAEW